MLNRSLLFAVALAVGCSQAHSQSECPDLLKYGIYDLKSQNTAVDQAESFSNWICSNESDISKQSDDTKLFGAIPYKDIKLDFGYNKSSDNSNAWVHDYCATVNSSTTLKLRTSEVVQKISKDLLDAFNACLQVKGLHVWLEPTAVPTVVNLAATFNSPGDPAYAYVTGFSASPGDKVHCEEVSVRSKYLVGSFIWPGDKIDGGTRRWKCTRNASTTPINITFNATSKPLGGENLNIAGGPEPLTCPSNCSDGCRKINGKPACTVATCIITAQEAGIDLINREHDGFFTECNLAPGNVYVLASGGTAPKEHLTPNWWLNLTLGVDPGTGVWNEAEYVNEVIPEVSVNPAIQYSGLTEGDGPVRTKLHVTVCQTVPADKCNLTIDPKFTMTISSRPIHAPEK